ncbi:phytanoyl-CoA dioxygenase family protein [Trinickia sp.]|uniref:phytanoyl-CoA dioxygenase family protein n=1 Tax=Trinickia sp. TaxID=2571163 RepID=UPI003F81EEBC
MSKERYYGADAPRRIDDLIERGAEELTMLGYTVVEDVLPTVELGDWRRRIDAAYSQQEAELGGRSAMAAIGEADLCRAPLLYDPSFLSLARNETVLKVVRRMIGQFVVLHLQNAIINRSDEPHHQGAWHRDLPHQHWTSSKPLAIGALFAIDRFDASTGGTLVLPHTHRFETLPSEQYIRRHAAQVVAEPGSVLIFDAMVFHRAGDNRSGQVRRGVNHLYTVPILKPQYDFVRALGDEFGADPELRQLLGFTSAVPVDALDWRTERQRRLSIQQSGNTAK